MYQVTFAISSRFARTPKHWGDSRHLASFLHCACRLYANSEYKCLTPPPLNNPPHCNKSLRQTKQIKTEVDIDRAVALFCKLGFHSIFFQDMVIQTKRGLKTAEPGGLWFRAWRLTGRWKWVREVVLLPRGLGIWAQHSGNLLAISRQVCALWCILVNKHAVYNFSFNQEFST